MSKTAQGWHISLPVQISLLADITAAILLEEAKMRASQIKLTKIKDHIVRRSRICGLKFVFRMSCLFCTIPFTVFIHPNNCIARVIHISTHEVLPHYEFGWCYAMLPSGGVWRLVVRGFDIPDGGINTIVWYLTSPFATSCCL